MDKRILALINSKSGGGSGGSSVSVKNCTINSDGDLIITLSDGTTLNAGKAKGTDGVSPKISGTSTDTGADITVENADGTTTTVKILNGSKGEKGDTGAAGTDGKDGASPVISVYKNTSDLYQLKITNADGTSFITPNLQGAGTGTTKTYLYDNSLYTNYVDSIYVYNASSGTTQSLGDLIAAGKTTCSSKNNYAIYINTTDFGWANKGIVLHTTPVEISSTQMILETYISKSQQDEHFYFIPAELVTSTTQVAEIANAMKTLLTAETLDPKIIDMTNSFEYVSSAITEAVTLESVASGSYYFAWTGTSNNSAPMMYNITIM